MKALPLLLLLLAGCAINNPNYTEWDPVTGKRTKRLAVPSVVWWPATSTLEKQRVSIGKTMSVGTSGLSEDGGGTNMVEALKYLDSILSRIGRP